MAAALTPDEAEEYVRQWTQVVQVPLCPELRLRVGYPLFRQMILERREQPAPPYWAFVWGSGQALARYLFDYPECVRGKSVLDLGAGSGIVAVSAALCGAAPVTAAERDHHGQAAVRLNARLHEVRLEVTGENPIGTPGHWQVVLAADVFYEGEQVAPLSAWFDQLTARGQTVLVADPGRPQFPVDRCQMLHEYDVTMYPDIETFTSAGVYQWRP